MIATTRCGSGPAVLWIHGYTMDSTVWAPLWEQLPGWHHVGVDLPGHGRAAPIPEGLSLPQLAAALAELARETGARRVVALSFGSLVAVQLALDHPGLVERLVLAAPTLGGAASDPVAARRYRELVLLHRLVGPGAALVDLWMQSPPDIFRGTERHPQVRARLREACLRHPWTELRTGAMAALTAHRHGPAELASIRAATLVLVGDEDMPAFVGNAALLAEHVPNCRVVTVARAGHLPLLERPAPVAGLVAAHLLQDGPHGGQLIADREDSG